MAISKNLKKKLLENKNTIKKSESYNKKKLVIIKTYKLIKLKEQK